MSNILSDDNTKNLHVVFSQSTCSAVLRLVFHTGQPWIFVSFENGVVQIWDYETCALVDNFRHGSCAVRGLDISVAKDWILTGGDDAKIIVWDYQMRKDLFTLTGHTEALRSVEFHPNNSLLPWILSASDDQTLRIWDYEKRTCLAVLTGHSNYVMCAKFHPTDDLVVSASLDQTVRVWDTLGLRNKQTTKEGAGIPTDDAKSQSSSGYFNLFGINDVVVKFILEGNQRGVNVACFHPSEPLVVSGGDDYQVRRWKLGEEMAHELKTSCSGLYRPDRISSVVFHGQATVSGTYDSSVQFYHNFGEQCNCKEVHLGWGRVNHLASKEPLLACGTNYGFKVLKMDRETVMKLSDCTNNAKRPLESHYNFRDSCSWASFLTHASIWAFLWRKKIDTVTMCVVLATVYSLFVMYKSYKLSCLEQISQKEQKKEEHDIVIRYAFSLNISLTLNAIPAWAFFFMPVTAPWLPCIFLIQYCLGFAFALHIPSSVIAKGAQCYGFLSLFAIFFGQGAVFLTFLAVFLVAHLLYFKVVRSYTNPTPMDQFIEMKNSSFGFPETPGEELDANRDEMKSLLLEDSSKHRTA